MTPPQATASRSGSFNIFPTLTLILLALAPLTGCRRGGDPVPAATEPAAAPVAQVEPGVTPAQLAGLSNQWAAAQAAQADLVRQLQARLDKVEEQRSTQSTALQQLELVRAAEQKSHEAKAGQLQGRITELEARVTALQSARVLPEIKVPAVDGPTTAELDQKIRIAERKQELAAEEAAAREAGKPRLTAGPSGFALSSADTNFVLRLRGLVQLDSRSFFDDNPLLLGNDGFTLRRVRPILEGTVLRDFSFQFTPDFAGTSPQIFDAWLNYKYRPELQLRAGKFKGPVGFENLQSDAMLPFNERSMVSALVPVRAVGVQLGGEAFDARVSYAAGVFNAGGDSRNPGSSNVGDDVELAARLGIEPFKTGSSSLLRGLGLGVAGSYSLINSNSAALPSTTGGTLPGYTTSGLQQFFAYNPAVGSGTVVADGAHWRLSPQVTYLYGPFGLLGEYALSHQEVLNTVSRRAAGLDHAAWQASAQWVLTGEKASFTGIVPRQNFNPLTGHWGAWQLVGRFGQLDIDGDTFGAFANAATSARRATGWAAGLNWWLSPNVRVLTSFSQTTFDGGGAFDPRDSGTLVPPATVTHQAESVFFTRLQLSF